MSNCTSNKVIGWSVRPPNIAAVFQRPGPREKISVVFEGEAFAHGPDADGQPSRRHARPPAARAYRSTL